MFSTSIEEKLRRYVFSVGEVVTVGGNPKVLAEVLDTSGEQLKVSVLTPPQRGKILYTTRSTFYTTPVPNVTASEIREKYSSIDKKKNISASMNEYESIELTNVEPASVGSTNEVKKDNRNDEPDTTTNDTLNLMQQEEIIMSSKVIEQEMPTEHFDQLSLF